MKRVMGIVGDLLHIGWYLTWRTALFMGGVIGVMYLVALVEEL